MASIKIKYKFNAVYIQAIHIRRPAIKKLFSPDIKYWEKTIKSNLHIQILLNEIENLVNLVTKLWVNFMHTKIFLLINVAELELEGDLYNQTVNREMFSSFTAIKKDEWEVLRKSIFENSRLPNPIGKIR